MNRVTGPVTLYIAASSGETVTGCHAGYEREGNVTIHRHADGELADAEGVLRCQNRGARRSQACFVIATADEQNLIERAKVGIPAGQEFARGLRRRKPVPQTSERVGMRSGTNRDDGDVIGHRGLSSGIASVDRLGCALSASETALIAVARSALCCDIAQVQLALTLCRYQFLLWSKG
jgi:hypothetical protein